MHFRLFHYILVFITLSLVSWFQPGHAQSEQLPTPDNLVSAIRFAGPLTFCGEKVPFNLSDVRERFEKDFMLSLWDRPQVILWLKRSKRYLPYIERMLRDSGMPDDLKFIAIAESALRPHVGSKKGAIGFWQFKAATARKYGLTVDRYLDERRSIFTSTPAAIRYLKALHQKFDSWTLAAAAYNMGEGGLQAEIMEQGIKDYYKLYLPLETQRYIFRILSAKLILSNPDKYGFHLNPDDYFPPLRFDQITVDCVQEIPIRIIAQAARTHFKVVKDLNPERRGHYLARGKHVIRVPEGTQDGFEDRYRNLEDSYLADQKQKIYIVKDGDNLSTIAEKFGVPLAALIIWNRIDIKRPIHPGDRLIIHHDR